MSPFKTLMTGVALTILGLGVAVSLYSLLPERSELQRLELIPVTMVDLKLTIPHAFFRNGAISSQGLSERIDLVMRYPEMDAQGAAPAKPELAPDPRLLVFVSIQRNDGVLDPAERVSDLYGRFLETTTFENPGGLLMKRFSAESPYADEELFIAPPDGRVFAARCRKPDKTSSIGEACLWRFRQSGADLVVRFAPELLPNWETMAQGLALRLREWSGQ